MRSGEVGWRAIDEDGTSFHLADPRQPEAGGCAQRVCSRPDLPTSSESLFARVVALGFAPADIRDAGDRFIVQGDMVLPKARVAMMSGRDTTRRGGLIPQGPQRQYSTGLPVGGPFNFWSEPTYVYVDLTAVDAENAEWATAFREGIASWNTIAGSNVVVAEAPWSANLTVAFGDPGSCGDDARTIACAEFPRHDPSCDAYLCPVVPGPHITIVRSVRVLSGR